VPSSESAQHRELKEIISKKLKEWTGATLQEYPSSGHELDVFGVTSTGISIYVEIIWSSSRTNFFRDMNMIQTSDANVKLVVAQVFTHTGEGLVLKGGRALVDRSTRSPYLSEKVAFHLMNDALEVYKKQMRQLPTRLVVHKSSRFRSEELSGFKEAAKNIEMMDFVTILNRGIKFMRKEGIYPPVRGTVVKVGEGDYILHTKGWIPYFETYPGLRVPTPLEIVEHHGDTPLSILFEEIFALTKMNWNSANFCIREPITLAYSREVGKILAYVPEEVIPRPEYLYYM